MFIDTARIHTASGKGGNGCNSYLRDRRIGHPRPNGGPGGAGGDVIIMPDTHVHTLLDFQYQRHFSAQKGENGSSNDKKGAAGKSCVIKVPPGTVIKDAKTNLILRDLDRPDKQVIVCRGGRGGRGNAPFKEALPGGPPEEKDLLLELKVIADVGIVGFPNAGKSTLISRVSKARPRIADFPFTTKAPVLGIVEISAEARFVICEIPGLIEGAYLGKGLGHQFLRHAERTKALVHLIDMAGIDGRKPEDDYKILNKELLLHNKEMAKRPQVIAANKMDLPQVKENLKRFRKVVKKKIYPISSATGEGVKELMKVVYSLLQRKI